MMAGPRAGQRYRNQVYTDCTFIGHGGYGGQYLMARPDKEAAVGFMSLLQTSHGSDPSHLPEVIAAAIEILDRL